MAKDNEVILWLRITADHAEKYEVDHTNPNNAPFNGIPATHAKLDWQEVWFFNVVNDGFGDKWEMVKDNYAILQGMGVGFTP